MNNLIALPVFIPLSGALIAVCLGNKARLVCVLSMLMTALLSIYLCWLLLQGGSNSLALGGWLPGLGIRLQLDPLSALFLILSSVLGLGALLSTSGYATIKTNQEWFWPLWLLLFTALHALFLSGDLFNLYVTLELLGIAAVSLCVLSKSTASLEASLRYLVVGLLGSMLFLSGVTLLYAEAGSLDLKQVQAAIGGSDSATVAAALITSGLLVKSALFPLHYWLPPAHANAPAPVSAALSALVVKAAFYLLLRLWLDLFSPMFSPLVGIGLGALGALAVLWGSWMALRAARLKLMAAYSTVAQLGYLFMFFPLLSLPLDSAIRQGLISALILMALTHAFAKSALFLAAGAVMRLHGHDRIAELQGGARTMPMTTFILAMAGIALIGLPPSGAFIGKWYLLDALIGAQMWPWVAVLLLGTMLACAYVFRLLGHLFSALPNTAHSSDEIKHQAIPALAMACIATFGLGLVSAPLWELLAWRPWGGG